MKIKDYKWHQQLYLYGSILSYSVFILTLTGVVTFAPSQVMLLQKLLKYYVCLFLIIRFNPLIKTKNNCKKVKDNILVSNMFELLKFLYEK